METSVIYDLVRCVDCGAEWDAAYLITDGKIREVADEMICDRCGGFALATANWSEETAQMLRYPGLLQ